MSNTTDKPVPFGQPKSAWPPVWPTKKGPVPPIWQFFANTLESAYMRDLLIKATEGLNG